MKLLPTASVVLVLLSTSAAMAQSAGGGRVPKVPSPPATRLQTPLPAAGRITPPSLSAPAVTPELWIYSQELQRHDDPAQAVRRKAELKADERLSRLAALKWYGQSNARPDACPIPLMSAYSPSWIGNGWERYGWAAFGASATVLRVETIGVAR